MEESEAEIQEASRFLSWQTRGQILRHLGLLRPARPPYLVSGTILHSIPAGGLRPLNHHGSETAIKCPPTACLPSSCVSTRPSINPMPQEGSLEPSSSSLAKKRGQPPLCQSQCRRPVHDHRGHRVSHPHYLHPPKILHC